MPKIEVAGYFDAVVVGQEIRRNDKGNYMVNLMMEVTEGEQKGRHTWIDLYLTQQAIKYTMEKLDKCFGFKGELPALRDVDFTGQPVRFHMVEEEYNGATTLKCKGIFNIGGGQGYKRPSDDEWRDLMEMTGYEIEKPKPAPLAQPTNTVDELPF